MNDIALFQRMAQAQVVTATNRLAQHLRHRYDLWQSELGQAVWHTPQVMPQADWLSVLFERLQFAGALPDVGLLDSHQAYWLMHQVIAQSAEGQYSLQADQLTAPVLSAWQLCQSYLLDVADAAFDTQIDYQMLRVWGQAYQLACDHLALIDRATLPTLLTHYLPQYPHLLPQQLILCGFDDVTPQLQRLLATLEAAGCGWELYQSPAPRGELVIQHFSNAEEEMRAMAAFADTFLQRHPGARIACVVPNLAQVQQDIDRLFAEQLRSPEHSPQTLPLQPLYTLSAGKNLLNYPLVRTAWQLLQSLLGELPLHNLSSLLRSPFLGYAETELASRANLDALLHTGNKATFTLNEITALASTRSVQGFPCYCEYFAQILRAIENTLPAPLSQAPSLWLQHFRQLLSDTGWPGERQLNSHEFQMAEAMLRALDKLAQLDVTHPVVSLNQALQMVQQIWQHTIFQVANKAAPIHILGPLEITGLNFDAVWVMGLTAQSWPGPANPNPFIPQSLQQALNMPHASAARELNFCELLTEQFVRAGKTVHFSYPRMDGETPLSPSPLLNSLAITASPGPAPRTESLHLATDTLETVTPTVDRAPALAAEETIRGGTHILKSQAACPFQAFAYYRLGAREIGQIATGIDARHRGLLIHRSLELIWTALGSQATLAQMPETERLTLVERSIAQSLEELTQTPLQQIGGTLAALEHTRLQRLLLRWLALELDRPPFSVVATEQRQQIQLGDLTLNMMLDRIDKVGDNYLIIDYKTSKPSVYAWFGERPDEPQLPLYCISAQQPVDGLVFAEVRTEQPRLKGVASDTTLVPNTKTPADLNLDGLDDWTTLTTYWDKVLHQLANDFSRGVAEVDPKHPTSVCQFCALHSLCRIPG